MYFSFGQHIFTTLTNLYISVNSEDTLIKTHNRRTQKTKNMSNKDPAIKAILTIDISTSPVKGTSKI